MLAFKFHTNTGGSKLVVPETKSDTTSTVAGATAAEEQRSKSFVMYVCIAISVYNMYIHNKVTPYGTVDKHSLKTMNQYLDRNHLFVVRKIWIHTPSTRDLTVGKLPCILRGYICRLF